MTQLIEVRLLSIRDISLATFSGWMTMLTFEDEWIIVNTIVRYSLAIKSVDDIFQSITITD